MNEHDLIAYNMKKTQDLFAATHFTLPKLLFTEREKSFKKTILPEPKNIQFLPANINSIAPTAIIDTTPARSKPLVNSERDLPTPKPHRNWFNYMVLAGHSAWVKCISFDKSNDFFVTGSLDHMIKFWKLAECELRNTFTGHTGAVYGVCLSQQNYPYLYSCGDAKEVYNWDLTTNTIIRRFFGHFSGVYCVTESPSSALIATGSRDASAKVWDIRTQQAAFTLTGHDKTIFDILFQDYMPHIVTASADATIRLWDLRTGKCYAVLTNHRKTIRKLVAHPNLWSFVSASQDAIFQWNGEEAALYKEFKSHETIINSLAINEDGVMVSCGDDGTLKFWDFDSAHCFQETRTIAQPGSLPSECGIFDCAFDMTGTRFITCEADKTVKLWKEVNENGMPY